MGKREASGGGEKATKKKRPRQQNGSSVTQDQQEPKATKKAAPTAPPAAAPVATHAHEALPKGKGKTSDGKKATGQKGERRDKEGDSGGGTKKKAARKAHEEEGYEGPVEEEDSGSDASSQGAWRFLPLRVGGRSCPVSELPAGPNHKG